MLAAEREQIVTAIRPAAVVLVVESRIKPPVGGHELSVVKMPTPVAEAVFPSRTIETAISPVVQRVAASAAVAAKPDV